MLSPGQKGMVPCARRLTCLVIGQPPAVRRPRNRPLAHDIQRALGLTTLRVGTGTASTSDDEKLDLVASADHDIDVLKAKIDAGATRAITQFFFDVDGFLRFMEKVRRAGVTIPISPGIMPVTNYAGLRKMAGPIGIRLPDWLGNLFDGLDKDPETRRLIAGSIASEMCARLAEEGFSDFHFYTLNRADLTYAICRILGVRETSPEPKEAAA